MATGEQHLYEATSINLKKKQAVYALLTCLNTLADKVLESRKAEDTMLELNHCTRDPALKNVVGLSPRLITLIIDFFCHQKGRHSIHLVSKKSQASTEQTGV